MSRSTYLAVTAFCGLGAAGLYYSTLKRAPITAALVKDTFVDFKLSKIDQLTANTKLFRFKLEKNQVLGLPVSGLIMAKVVDADGNEIVRPYTPVSESDALGHFDLVIKIYPTGTFF